MPPVNIHLVALKAGQTVSTYVNAVRSRSSILVASRCIRWIIRPEKIDTSELLDTKWDVLLVAPKTSPVADEHLSQKWVSKHYSITAGVPSSLVNGFADRNQTLLHPRPASVPALTGSKPRKASSAQGLELNDELEKWAQTFSLGKSAVSMLNLLAFKPGKAAHESYQEYGRGFVKSAGAKRGGTAKIVGRVIDEDSRWQEIALAHYPSIFHFTEMLASEDYQEINHRFRLPALEDTCILCTTELDPELDNDKAKL